MDQQLTASALLNNQAINMLKHGAHLNAVGKLTSSLHIVKNLMGSVRWDDDNDFQDIMMNDETSEASSDIVFCGPQESFSCRQTANQDESDMGMDATSPHEALHKTIEPVGPIPKLRYSDTDRQDTYIYDTPLHIWPSALTSRDLTPELLSELSVALMFNLALCHHMRALHADTCAVSVAELHSVKLVFQQAVCLYELAYEVQMQDGVELSVECTMAIVNNLGHIHQRLGNVDKASKCFSHLLSTLLFVQSTSICYETDEVSEGSIKGFLRSVSSLILSEKVAAAA